jgi:tetratricopeptide (TPR) repeat protein
VLRLLVSLTFLIIGIVAATAQNARLAEEYFRSGEYEKAAFMFKQLYDKSPANDYYLNRFIDSKIALDQYEDALDIVQKAIKADPNTVSYYVSLGMIYERQGETEKSEKEYLRAIEKMPPDRFQINRLANAFMSQTKYDLAIEAFRKGSDLLNDDGIFAYNLAELYRRKGEREEMMRYYLFAVEINPQRLPNVKSIFSRELKNEDLRSLLGIIYERISETEDVHDVYPELLEWVFIQQKDYKNALRQVKSLDRKRQENGFRVYQLANTASFSGSYEEAIDAYEYILNEKGPQCPYYVASKQQLLDCKRRQLADLRELNAFTMEELESEYVSFLDEYGRNRETAPFMVEWAKLSARYMDDLEKAITILNDVISMGGVNKYVTANAKLQLGDYYLIKGEIWEATLLYSQVDKAFKEELLGEEARYRNAKLSYYAGDFEWAQEQFDIMKVATSKLIANDALDLSIFIMDNLNLDTTAMPLSMYARAELLNFQNKFEEAFIALDSIVTMFPEHSLEDDIYYLKAKVYRNQGKFDLAEEYYTKVIENFSEGIRADNSIFELAGVYEKELERTTDAQILYEKLFIDYSNSTFAVEARKRYRLLRGDDLPN